jgi:hypothetical protein
MNQEYKPKKIRVSVQVPVEIYPDGNFVFDADVVCQLLEQNLLKKKAKEEEKC